jgi:hypothetical protein
MIKVSQQFIDDFTLCMKHYECSEEEIAEAKIAVRENYDLASKSYAEIAENLRRFPEAMEEQRYILVSDMIFDSPKKKEPVKKVGGKKVVVKKKKAAEQITFKE